VDREADESVGLSSAEAARRIARDGPNELEPTRTRTLAASVLALVREPMTLLLIACGVTYALLGDRGEALLLLGFVVFILAITLAEERKTERALGALRELSNPRALVVRDGARMRIPGRDVVRGDLVVVSEGDRVPADAAVVSSPALEVDESLLTGESAPVRKRLWNKGEALLRPGGDETPFLYAGTLIVQGSALALVLATGGSTEMGRVGRALDSGKKDTALAHETHALVRALAIASASLAIVVAVVYALTRSDWLGGALVGLTLAMAILPNELPVVVTLYLGLGAFRLSRDGVLARRMSAVSALGSLTVLCVDKTGTITENRMRVARVVADGVRFDVGRSDADALPEAIHRVVETAILASRKDPFDPMERAFLELGSARLAGTEHLHPSWSVEREYPLSRELFAMGNVWDAADESERVVALKGAPEAVAELTGLDDEAREALFTQARKLGADGLRVLAIAHARWRRNEALPATLSGFKATYLGLVGLADPVRAGVTEAVNECHGAGLRVIMITGDFAATAESVARSIALRRPGPALLGSELGSLSDEALLRRVAEVDVFARVLPEQKLRLVEALRRRGEVIAMTGDGVNDAPALVAADLGIAMGERGTDVAREAASMVLLGDDFASIVSAVRIGRRVLDNLEKALAFVIAVHIPIVGLTLVPVALRLPLVLMPAHIAFLHLVIDPVCSIVFESEPEEPGLMKRPPRPPKAPLFERRVLFASGLQGLAVFCVVGTVYLGALASNAAEPLVRSMTFTSLVIADLGVILANRKLSREDASAPSRANPWLWSIFGATLGALALVVYVPPLASLFRFASLPAWVLGICAMCGLLCYAVAAWLRPSRCVRA